MTRIALAVAALAVAACGPTPPAPARSPSPPPVAAAAEPAALLLEYVVVHRRWVEKVAPAAPGDVKAWAELPENGRALAGPLRQIVVRIAPDAPAPAVASARKRAQGLLDRLRKGEEFERVARASAEDTPTDDPEAVRASFEALKPGETAPDLVRSSAGFHVVRKDRATDEQIERAYRRARAPTLARALADELLRRIGRGEAARPAIAEGVLAVLGERAANDPDRPGAAVIDRDRLKQVRLPAAARAALETFAGGAQPGDALPSPAVDGDTIVVARALPVGR